jgi:RimJ/RimL family protein N-acetyltransferase
MRRIKAVPKDPVPPVTSTLEASGAVKPISLRPVAISDAEFLYKLASDGTARKNFMSPEPPAWESHLAWLHETIAQHGSRMGWIVTSFSGQALGFVWAEKRAGAAVVSINLAREARRRGIGVAALRRLSGVVSERWPTLPLRAYIKSGNTASVRAFEYAGYRLMGWSSQGGEYYELYGRAPC